MCSRFAVESSSDGVEENSTCALNSTTFPYSNKLLLASMGLVIFRTCFVRCGCLHTFSVNLFTSTSDWFQRSKLLRVSLFMSSSCTISANPLSVKLKNARFAPVFAAGKPRSTTSTGVFSGHCTIARFSANLPRCLNLAAISNCSSDRNENAPRNTVVSLSFFTKLNWLDVPATVFLLSTSPQAVVENFLLSFGL